MPRFPRPLALVKISARLQEASLEHYFTDTLHIGTEMTQTTPAKSLLDYARNVYSQHGEDGIIERIIQTLPEDNKWCVEFGAWDGLHLTNTRYLIESHGFSAVLIEASSKKYLDLQKNYAGKPHVIPVNCFVGFEVHDGLDTILKKTPIPKDFAVLSIDIDGNDYHVWKAIEHYRPKVVVIEFNPTFPVGVDYIQPADPSINHGSSLSAIVKLGLEKGYELIAVNALNGAFLSGRNSIRSSI